MCGTWIPMPSAQMEAEYITAEDWRASLGMSPSNFVAYLRANRDDLPLVLVFADGQQFWHSLFSDDEKDWFYDDDTDVREVIVMIATREVAIHRHDIAEHEKKVSGVASPPTDTNTPQVEAAPQYPSAGQENPSAGEERAEASPQQPPAEPITSTIPTPDEQKKHIPRDLWAQKPLRKVCDDMRVAAFADDAIAYALHRWRGVKNMTELGVTLRDKDISSSGHEKYARKKLKEAGDKYYTT